MVLDSAAGNCGRCRQAEMPLGSRASCHVGQGLIIGQWPAGFASVHRIPAPMHWDQSPRELAFDGGSVDAGGQRDRAHPQRAITSPTGDVARQTVAAAR